MIYATELQEQQNTFHQRSHTLPIFAIDKVHDVILTICKKYYVPYSNIFILYQKEKFQKKLQEIYK